MEAAQLAASGGLRALLDEQGVVIQGMSDTTVDSIGEIISQGLAIGAPVDGVASRINEYVDNPDRAFLIAQTETSRAMIGGQADQYQQLGFSQFEWLAYDGACDLCLDEEDSNPHDFGDEQPPGHPSCRCSIIGTGDIVTPEGALDTSEFDLTSTEDAQVSSNASVIEDAVARYATKRAAQDDLAAIREEIMLELREAREIARQELHNFGGDLMKPPAKTTTRDLITGRVTRTRGAGEWDFWDQLHPEEQARIRRGAFSDHGDGGFGPDQLRSMYENAGHGTFESDSEAMEHFVKQTRIVDMVDTIESKGSIPSTRALANQFAHFDPNELTRNSPYRVTDIFATKTKAVDYLMSLRGTAESRDAAEFVERELTLPYRYGASPYELSRDDYVAQLFDLWEQVDAIAAKEAAQAADEWGYVRTAEESDALTRWNVFMPRLLVDDINDVDPYALYDQIIALAKMAGKETA